MEIIDRYLTRYFRRRVKDKPTGLDLATIKAILEDFLTHADWLEAEKEMILLESAMEELTDRSLDDLSALELVQTVRAHVSLLRVKLAISNYANESLRQRFLRP